MPNIIITGASDGIGAEIARQLARRHGLQALLVLAARNTAASKSVTRDKRNFRTSDTKSDTSARE